MDFSTEEILTKLNITQLKSLITLYGLEKPHSKSTKTDYISYIQGSNAVLDPRMLINYFGLNLKQKKSNKNLDITNEMDNVSQHENENENTDEHESERVPKPKQSSVKRARSPKRRSSKK